MLGIRLRAFRDSVLHGGPWNEKWAFFTADPYSKVMDFDDKKTATLFGDGAAVTWIGTEPRFQTGQFLFGSNGKKHEGITVRDNGILEMNGRAVFTFSVRVVPKNILEMLEKNRLEIEHIDLFLLHQGSLHIVNSIADALGVPREKCPFHSGEYGNTVSSSIPMLLHREFNNPTMKTAVISGFGVGFPGPAPFFTGYESFSQCYDFRNRHCLSTGHFNPDRAKTAFGLVRGSERFHVLAVIDSKTAGQDAGDIVDSKKRDIPVFGSVNQALEKLELRPQYAVIGITTPGGILPDYLCWKSNKRLRQGLILLTDCISPFLKSIHFLEKLRNEVQPFTTSANPGRFLN